jgi:hypothetical protein
MITVHTVFQSHFREIAATTRDSFDLETPLVSELADRITEKYGAKMKALLIDPVTNDLNERGTMFVDTKGRRISIDDTLNDGETITFLVGIAGG